MRSPEVPQSNLATTRAHRERLLSLLFPAKIFDPHQSLARVHEMAVRGYGLIVAVNHFSLRDGPAAFTYIAGRDEVLLGKPWLAPIALHQYGLTKRMNELLGTAIDLKPIVTPDTLGREKFANETKGDGSIAYLRDSIKTLKEGGVVVVFPQVGRRTTLGEADPDNTVMEYLCKSTTRAGVDTLVVLPVGFSLRGTTDYEHAAGLNLFRQYDVHIGPAVTKGEMLTQAASVGQSPDAWIFSQLTALVPQHYTGGSSV